MKLSGLIQITLLVCLAGLGGRQWPMFRHCVERHRSMLNRSHQSLKGTSMTRSR